MYRNKKRGGVLMANNDWINQVIEDTLRGKTI